MGLFSKKVEHNEADFLKEIGKCCFYTDRFENKGMILRYDEITYIVAPHVNVRCEYVILKDGRCINLDINGDALCFLISRCPDARVG